MKESTLIPLFGLEIFSVTELCEYAANVDIPIARESIRAVGKIALQQYDVNAIVDRLLQFLEMEKDYVTAETLVNIDFMDVVMLIVVLQLNFLLICLSRHSLLHFLDMNKASSMNYLTFFFHKLIDAGFNTI